jgi:hypothetical protein
MPDHYTVSGAPEKWDQLYSVIGLVATESSTAHWFVFELFRIVLKMEREEAATLYYALRADAGQRDITLSVLIDRLKTPEELELLVRIKKTFDALGKASGRRNGFIHTPWSMWYSSEEFTPSHGAPLHPKLKPDDILGQANALIKELRSIIDELLALCDELELLPSLQKR